VRAVFLCEAGKSSGMGHLRRSEILAHALAKKGVSCRFGIDDPKGQTMMMSFPASTVKDALIGSKDILVVDGYNYTPQDMLVWHKQHKKVLLIDDLGEKPLKADIVLNHNIYGESIDYGAYPATEILAGPKFALISPRFSALQKHPLHKKTHILIAFGGGENARIGLEAAAELAARSDLLIDVALGTVTAKISHPNIYLHSQADMAVLMKRASLYFGALGVSFIEALSAGLPAIGVITAKNQWRAADAARKMNVPVFERDELDKAACAVIDLSNQPGNQPQIKIDGEGARRVASCLLDFKRHSKYQAP